MKVETITGQKGLREGVRSEPWEAHSEMNSVVTGVKQKSKGRSEIERENVVVMEAQE